MTLFNDLLLLISVYLILQSSSPPSLPGGDSGELLAVGCQLGTAHPPGYPLYTLIIHLWSQFTFQPRFNFDLTENSFSVTYETTVAWKINNLSCILSAFACLFLKLITKAVLTSVDRNVSCIVAPTFAAILFSLSPIVWEYSNAAEVFAVNNFLCAAVLYCTSRIYTIVQTTRPVSTINDPSSSSLDASPVAVYPIELYIYLNLGAMCSGLCLSNQHSSFFLVIALVSSILFISVQYKFFSLSVMYGLSCMFTAGVAPYLYLLYTSMNTKPLSWGHFSTMQGLLVHVLRSEYGTFQLGVKQGEEMSTERLFLSVLHASRECFHVIWPLFLLGFGWFFRDVMISLNESMNEDAKKKKKKNWSVTTSPVTQSTFHVNWSLYVVILFSWLFYQIMWHFVLSNLPITAVPMAYAVHARFWMQPLMLAVILAAVGLAAIERFAVNLVFPSPSSRQIPTTYVHSLSLISMSMELVVTLALLSFVCKVRWEGADRSQTGWTIHRYGEQLLSKIPENSLLVAHTDIDLNVVRYLRECEGLRPDITHLSFQYMPYPWFHKIQAPKYSNVTFIEPFRGISTERTHEANARLVGHFVAKNIDKFPAVFIDMQSINDMEVEDQGSWRGFTLVPYGPLYRVEKSPKKSIKHHKDSFEKVNNLSTILSSYDPMLFFRLYPPGSWEHAVASLVNDAKYQLGLYLLTYGISQQKNVQRENLLFILDRYYASASLLLDASLNSRLPLAIKNNESIVTTYENSFFPFMKSLKRHVNMESFESKATAFSGVMKDLYKNCALAWTRFITIANITRGIGESLQEILDAEKQLKDKKMRNKTARSLIRNDILVLVMSKDGYKMALTRAMQAISVFMSKCKDDIDFDVFKEELKKMERDLSQISSS